MRDLGQRNDRATSKQMVTKRPHKIRQTTPTKRALIYIAQFLLFLCVLSLLPNVS